ncbi:4Fe-4S binding protein [Oxalobacteraceae bacterium]|nr:4Fe-4S binding protein [Oxalobacteraceae bacterium]
MRTIACILLALVFMAPAHAGVLNKQDLMRRFPAPMMVGERDSGLPVWPLFRQNGTVTELAGYAFESLDLAPVPGFSGVPLNLLVAIDAQGGFLEVAVLSHHEPVFLDGLGEEPLLQFVRQYKGLSLKQNIGIDNGAAHARWQDEAHARIDGVAKATASVRIINQSVLAAALQVARTKLGFAQGRDPDMIARVRPELFEAMTLAQLLDAGLVRHLRVTQREMERLFKGSAGAGLDAQALSRPDEVFLDLYVALVSVPTAGRNLLTPRGWRTLAGRMNPGDHALLLISSGTWSLSGENFVRGSVPDRALLKQDGLPLEMRDLDLELALNDTALQGYSVQALRVISQAGLDPAGALELSFPVTRNKGVIYPERIVRDLQLSYRVPARFYVAAQGGSKSWDGVWQERRYELLALVFILALLGAALTLQRRLTARAGRFKMFRLGFLLLTVGFVGYAAQGQLSIVQLTGALQALMAGRSLAFLLFDPVSALLWVFVLVSLLLWGRGTFCGWLCPFGALQELVGKAARLLRVPQWRLGRIADARLKWLKYVLLAVIVISALWPGSVTDLLLELEPFKTAITLNFVRSWPFVAYAAGLLLASAFVYKFYCRYLCPLGALLALMGKLRMLNWIPRRAECGTPCQTCRHRCDYQAIKPGGEIVYAECFQCMDCVVIHASDTQCAPLIMERKLARTIPIVSASGSRR